jgi:16S rRNA pseudouridine516 synthase
MEVLANNRARLTLNEGRYHQVKRMFAATGNEVLELHRAAQGKLILGDLAQGEWRALTPDDEALLFA